jgi:hypothetical protein
VFPARPFTDRFPVHAPGIIRNSDGEKKRGCELAAGKRRIEACAGEYDWLKPALLGDDLYSNRPFCEKTVEKGRGFIFTRKEEPHQWLTETIKNSYLHGIREAKRDARKKKEAAYAWKYLNGPPIRHDKKDRFLG